MLCCQETKGIKLFTSSVMKGYCLRGGGEEGREREQNIHITRVLKLKSCSVAYNAQNTYGLAIPMQ